MAAKNYKKWDVVLIDLNPHLIISPNVANRHLQTVIVAPLTSTIRQIPTRLLSNFDGKPGEICFDQMRAVDKSRIIKVLGSLDASDRTRVNALLANMFSEL